MEWEEQDPEAFEKLCARLVRPPFCLSIEQIKVLTPYQVRKVFFRPEEQKSDGDFAALQALMGR